MGLYHFNLELRTDMCHMVGGHINSPTTIARLQDGKWLAGLKNICLDFVSDSPPAASDDEDSSSTLHVDITENKAHVIWLDNFCKLYHTHMNDIERQPGSLEKLLWQA